MKDRGIRSDSVDGNKDKQRKIFTNKQKNTAISKNKDFILWKNCKINRCSKTKVLLFHEMFSTQL